METAILVFFGLLLVVILAFLIRNWTKVKEFKEEVHGEMYKVTWPTQTEVINMTVLVFVVTGIMTVAVWLVDKVLGVSIAGLFKLLG